MKGKNAENVSDFSNPNQSTKRLFYDLFKQIEANKRNWKQQTNAINSKKSVQ